MPFLDFKIIKQKKNLNIFPVKHLQTNKNLLILNYKEHIEK